MERYANVEALRSLEEACQATARALLGKAYDARAENIGMMGYGVIVNTGEYSFLWGTALENWGADVYVNGRVYDLGVAEGAVETNVSSKERNPEILAAAMHVAMATYKGGK